MPGQQTRTRQQTVINYQANSQVQSQQLGLGMLYRELYLTLSGTIDTTGADIAPGNIMPGDEWGVIQRIDVLVNGTDNIISVTGEELNMWNTFMLGRPRDMMVLANGSSQQFHSVQVLPFWDKTSYTPIDSLLNSARLSDLRINVTWGNPANVVDAGTGSASFSVAPTLMVSSRECFGITGDFSVWRRLRLQDNNVVQNDEYTVPLPLGNVYRGFIINTKSANGFDLASCIDRVQLVSGTNVYFDLDYLTMQKAFRQNFRAAMANPEQFSALPSSNYLPVIGLSDGTDLGGWGYLDLVDDGYLTEAIDTIALSELKLKFKTNQTIPKFTVLPSQIIPVRKPKG